MGKFRTVEDLQELKGVIADTNIIHMLDTQQNNLYVSKKVSYSTLFNNISAGTIDGLYRKWNLNDTTPIKDSVDYTINLSSELSVVDGVIKINNAPQILSTSIDNNALQTREQIIGLVQDHTNYVAPYSSVTIDPKNDSGFTDEYQYMWKIENGKYDSSESLDEDGFLMDSVVIKKTGYLTVYGWLASQYNVEPQNAWVGLYGLVMTKTGARKWVLLQVQPWVVGKHAVNMQYIGFNIPVKENMRLKIMPGFPVNGNASGFQKDDGHSLLLTRIGNVPNTFVGYVLEN